MDCFLKRISLFFVTIASASGEVFTLKSGEKIEGEIIENTAETYKIRYQFSPSIRLEKVLKKDEVVEISQSQEISKDKEAFEKLSTYFPVPDAKPVSYYDKVLQNVLLPFKKKYPNSVYSERVEALTAQLLAEKEKVAAGALKMGGSFLSEEDIAKDAYHLVSEMYGARVAESLAQNKWLSTLRHFQALHDDYRYSKAYRRHREVVSKKLTAYLSLLEKKKEEASSGPSEELLKQLSQRERALLEEQKQNREAAIEKRWAQEIKQGEVWLTANYSDASSLTRMINQGKNLLKEIERTKEDETNGAALYREVKELIAGDDYKKAKTAAQKFSRLSPPEELKEEISAQLKAQNLRIKENYKRLRDEKAAARKKIAEEKRAAKKAERAAQKEKAAE